MEGMSTWIELPEQGTNRIAKQEDLTMFDGLNVQWERVLGDCKSLSHCPLSPVPYFGALWECKQMLPSRSQSYKTIILQDLDKT